MIDPARPDYASTPIAPSRGQFSYAPAKAASEPLVSIITPFFNTKELLHQTAQCVLNQSLQRFEWLIVNDCSTDPDALRILDQYRRQDARIRVIDHAQNKGPGAARNTGYAQARAPFVFQMDDDDLLELTAIEKMRWYLESFPEIALVNGWSVAFGAKEYLWPTGFERGDELLEENLATGRALVRVEAHRRAGGFDENIRGGMEDWDFWLRCAAAGLWGATIPEYLDWYRRRETHSDRWQDWDGGDRIGAFKKRLRQRYPTLYQKGVPRLRRRHAAPCDPVRPELPFANPLEKARPRVLLIVPWLQMGGADKVNFDILEQLVAAGWEATIVTTTAGDHNWLPLFARLTPDIFATYNFLAPADRPLFIRYLIESRQPDVVLLSNSELGYLVLPYLRSVCPGPAYVDLLHSETVDWKQGGYPRYSVGAGEHLDLSLAASHYLKNWMTQRGGDPQRIDVSHIGIDADLWKADPQRRAALRGELGIAGDTPVILFAGRIHSDKQPMVLGRTVEKLAAAGLDFVALAAGDGPERVLLERFIAEKRLEARLRLLGGMSSERVRELMSAADIFFLPSQWEGIALTFFEAMACGLAIVGADVGGQKELVTPNCGILLPRGDAESEAAAYAGVLGELLRDPARRREMGRRGRERIESGFSLQALGRRVLAAFERARELRETARRPALGSRYALEVATLGVEHMRMSDELDRYWAALHGGRAVNPRLELEAIENSRAWRLLRRVKASPPYRAWARLRYGAGWEGRAAPADPQQRLAQIKASTAYRLIQFAKLLPPYRWYARRKYGPDWDKSLLA